MTDNAPIKAERISRTIDTLFDVHQCGAGQNYVELLKGLQKRGITAFKEKFSPYFFKAIKLDANSIIDIGVDHKGTPALYHVFKDKPFLLIDPNPEALESCIKLYPWLRASTYCVAAGERPKKAILNVAVDSGQSSLMTRAIKAAKPMPITMVQVLPLDTIVHLSKIQGPFGLKIDAEGYEVEILKGAHVTLRQCAFVIAEISVKSIFTAGYRFSDAIQIMAKAGFELFDILNAQGSPPNHLDCLFLPRADSRFGLPNTSVPSPTGSTP